MITERWEGRYRLYGYLDKYIKCPFYKRTEAVKIHCEGVEDSLSIHIVFPSPDVRKDYQHSYCCTDKYRRCLVAQMNEKKWEGK